MQEMQFYLFKLKNEIFEVYVVLVFEWNHLSAGGGGSARNNVFQPKSFVF